jgi:hypothetical protein
VFETTISPGAAWAATRAATWTAIPRTPPGTSSHSPVCTRANLQVERAQVVADCPGRAYSAGRPVERREEAVAGSVDLGSSEALEVTAHDGMVLVEKLAPAPVAEGGGALRRADDVGEDERLQHPVGVGRVARAGQELLRLLEDPLRVDPRHVVLAGQLEEARPGNALG